MDKILVTGGAGYIGSHACKALAHAGFVPVAFDNLSRGHRWAVQYGPLEQGDLMDTEALRRAMRRHGVTAVMHFAASAYVGESMTDPARYFRNNVGNTVNLLEAMVDCGVEMLVLSSSCATYGNPARLPITEDHPQDPVNPYGESKVQMERTAQWFGQVFGLRWVALRYFNAAGADPDGEIGEWHDPETHLVPLAITACDPFAAPLTVFGTDYPTPDGTAIRDYVHVADLADAHVAALHHLLAGGGNEALNLGTGRGHSVAEIIEAVERKRCTKVRTIMGPRRTGDPAILVADPSKARKLLGWQPSRSDLETIVSTASEWHTRRVVPLSRASVQAINQL